jgi:hypothetical protein
MGGKWQIHLPQLAAVIRAGLPLSSIKSRREATS